MLAFPVNADKTKKGAAAFARTEYNFGSYRYGVVRRVVFIFVNTGNAPLVIQNTKTGCSCTSVSFSPKPVMPGKKGYVTVWFDSNKTGSGTFRKSVDIITNGEPGVVRLFISGVAK